MSIAEITTIGEWEKIKSQKDNKDLLVFKFSPICTISFTAGKVLETWFEYTAGNAGIKIVKVNVIKSRPVSNRIEEETSLRHESPQLIWFNKDGSIKWHGSHFMITEKSLTAQLEAV